MYGPSAAAGAVAAEVGGLPVLIDGDLEADVGLYRSMYGRPWLRVIIAAGWPRAAGVLKTTRGVRERRARLEAMGFRTCVRRGGLELEATPELLHRLKKRPVATAVVVPVLYEALRIVRLMGATPPRARTA